MNYKMFTYILSVGLISTTCSWGAEKEQKSHSARTLSLSTESKRMDDAHTLLQNTLLDGIDSLNDADRNLILKACEQLALNKDQTTQHLQDIDSLEECLRELAESSRYSLIEMIAKEKFESPLPSKLKSILEFSEEAGALEHECSKKDQELSTFREKFEQKLKEEETLKSTAERIHSKKQKEL